MEYNYPKFTPEMKKTHTILIPNMAITQFRFLLQWVFFGHYITVPGKSQPHPPAARHIFLSVAYAPNG